MGSDKLTSSEIAGIALIISSDTPQSKLVDIRTVQAEILEIIALATGAEINPHTVSVALNTDPLANLLATTGSDIVVIPGCFAGNALAGVTRQVLLVENAFALLHGKKPN